METSWGNGGVIHASAGRALVQPGMPMKHHWHKKGRTRAAAALWRHTAYHRLG